jgi:Fic family protein
MRSSRTSTQHWRGSTRTTQEEADLVGLNTIAQQLLRSESMASSQMEGIAVPSHRSLAKAEVGKRHKETAQAALANIAAVKWAYTWAATSGEPFSQDAIVAIHERVAAADRWLAAHGGRIRERQNWIGSDPYTPAGAEFIPPPPEYVPELLADLCAFLNRGDLPPVAQAAIAHVQFETIHPFADGNGRVGRAVIGARLARSGICRDVVPPISLVLSGRKDDYVDALTAFRRGDDDPWFQEATRQALNRLEEAGVVQLTQVAKRDRVWESIGVFALIDEMERELSQHAQP